jgi:hypothetical protein
MPIIPISGSAVGRGALFPIGNFVATTATATVNFLNIPQNYQDLLLVVSAHSNYAGDYFDGIGVVTNQVSVATNFNQSRMIVDYNGDVAFSRNAGLNGIGLLRVPPSFLGDYQSAQKLHLFNYANPNVNKTFLAEMGNVGEGLTSSIGVSVWGSNVPITSLSLSSDRGTSTSQFTTGTVMTLYGVRSVNQ